MSMNDDIKNILVSEEALKAKVAELGAQISRDYEGRKPCPRLHPQGFGGFHGRPDAGRDHPLQH